MMFFDEGWGKEDLSEMKYVLKKENLSEISFHPNCKDGRTKLMFEHLPITLV